MATSEKLFSREFLILNLVFFTASTATAVFFQFHQYLQFLGISQGWSGFIIAADALPALFLQPILGVFLDRFNARRWLFSGLICMVAALLAYTHASSVAFLVVVRLFQGAGFACLVAAMMVMIVDYIPPQRSGAAFGIISTIRLLPYAIIPPAMSAYFNSPKDFSKAPAYSVVPIIFSLAAVLTIEIPRASNQESDSRQSLERKNLIENLKDRRVSIVLIINLLLYSGYTTVFFFLEGYFRQVGVENPGLFFTIATFTMIGIRILGSTLFDKVSKVRLTFWSMAGLIICYSALPAVSCNELFYILGFFTGIGWGIIMPVLNALMFEVSAPPLRGLNLNLSLVMMQGGFFAGPFLGGLVNGWWGYGVLFYFCAFLSLVSASLTLYLAKRKT